MHILSDSSLLHHQHLAPSKRNLVLFGKCSSPCRQIGKGREKERDVILVFQHSSRDMLRHHGASYLSLGDVTGWSPTSTTPPDDVEVLEIADSPGERWLAARVPWLVGTPSSQRSRCPRVQRKMSAPALFIDWHRLFMPYTSMHGIFRLLYSLPDLSRPFDSL